MALPGQPAALQDVLRRPPAGLAPQDEPDLEQQKGLVVADGAESSRCILGMALAAEEVRGGIERPEHARRRRMVVEVGSSAFRLAAPRRQVALGVPLRWKVGVLGGVVAALTRRHLVSDACEGIYIRVEHITDHAQWTVFLASGVYSEGRLVLEQSGPGQSLLQHAFGRRRSFSGWELQQALMCLDLPEKDREELHGKPQRDILRYLVMSVCEYEQEAERILRLYEKDPVEEDAEDTSMIDEEMGALLEELAMTDQVNTSDLKGWKGEADKRKLTRINRQRAERRRVKHEAKGAKEKRAAARRLRAKAKSLATSLRRRARHASVSGGVASQPPPPQPASAPEIGPVAAPPAPQAAAVGAAEAPAASAPPAAVRAPRAVGGWLVLEVPGGWLRYNKDLGRLDSHCRWHAGCKMDRTLKRAPVGLCMSWLSKDVGDKGQHDELKVHLSMPAAREDRMQGRAMFASLADRHGGVFRDVLELEQHLRGGATDEPESLPVTIR